MKIFSDTFREALREDRQLNAIVSYRTSQSFNILTTQDDKNLMTENSDILVTEKGFLNYDKETINSVNPLFNTSLFKTTCKSVQIDSINKIEKGTWVNVKIGVYKEDTDSYEYLDFGNYYVNEEPTYQADTNSYLTTAYDKMIESMKSYDENIFSIEFPITHKDFVIAICNKFNWNYDLIDYPNYNKNIVQDFYKGQNLTYRDVLDDLNGVCGGSFMFNLDNKLIWKRPTETNEIVEDNDLKDTNVDFSEKFGKVNVLTITTNGNVVLDSKEDTQSIQENGKTEFNINDNYILNYSTDDFIDEIFNEINGLEYYLYDIDSTGLLIFEPLDIFTFRHNGVDYKTIMFNDDIKLTQGLIETTYAEKPEEVEKDYKTTDKNENKLNNALISLDKANAKIELNASAINDTNAQIVLKADANGKIVTAILEADPSKGSSFTIDADQVNLTADDILNLIAGNTINLTAKNIEINSTNFKVDKDGNLASKNGKFAGTIEGSTIKGGFIESTNYSNTNGLKINLGDGTFISREGITVTSFYQENELDGSTAVSMEGNSLDATYISCVRLDQTSLKENKKNFEKYNNALKEIQNIDIYKYNLKSESEETKKHLGFVIGDDFNYSQTITNNENTGVDIYSMVSLCLQAIKEQQEQIEKLTKDIEKLKGVDNNG